MEQPVTGESVVTLTDSFTISIRVTGCNTQQQRRSLERSLARAIRDSLPTASYITKLTKDLRRSCHLVVGLAVTRHADASGPDIGTDSAAVNAHAHNSIVDTGCNHSAAGQPSAAD